MLEEEEKAQRFVQLIYKLSQTCNIILLLLSAFISIVLPFCMLSRNDGFTIGVSLAGMLFFTALLGYSSWKLEHSLPNICFHLVLLFTFLAVQILFLILNLLGAEGIFPAEEDIQLEGHRKQIVGVLSLLLLVTVWDLY